MKKKVIILMLFSMTIFGFAKDYKVQLSENLYVGLSEAFECVATMAHLARYEEYCSPSSENSHYVKIYDDYFIPYMQNPDVAEALDYFRLIRMLGFAHDAVAMVGTYITEDCQSYRTSDDNLALIWEPRSGDPKKVLAAVSKFYNATNFDEFFTSHIEDIYSKLVELYISNADDLNRSIEEVNKYYKTNCSDTFISLSILCDGGYGCSFKDGKDIYFEPKYIAGYFDKNFLIHELSHPYSNPVAEKLYENKKIRNYFDKNLFGYKLLMMEMQSYNNSYTYIIELLNRANLCLMIKSYCDEEYYRACVANNKANYFTEIEEIIEILEEYNKGNYSSLMAFEPVLRKRLLSRIKQWNKKPYKTEFSPESLDSVTIFGKEYKATYWGDAEMKTHNYFVARRIWKIEDAYEDFKNCWPCFGGYMSYSNYPKKIEENSVFRVEYLSKDGIVYTHYYESPYYENPDSENPYTYMFMLE